MKQIPLTKGKFAIVDDEDYDFLMQWKWHFNKGYARRRQYICTIGGKEIAEDVTMHSVINKTPDDMWTDHRDLDKLNNQKYNLRNATPLNNVWNREKQSTKSSSKYKGVSWHKGNKSWQARIKAHGKQISLGSFPLDQEKEAGMAYNQAAIKLHGEFACLNKI